MFPTLAGFKTKYWLSCTQESSMLRTAYGPKWSDPWVENCVEMCCMFKCNMVRKNKNKLCSSVTSSPLNMSEIQSTLCQQKQIQCALAGARSLGWNVNGGWIPLEYSSWNMTENSAHHAGQWDACPFVSLTFQSGLTLEKSQCPCKIIHEHYLGSQTANKPRSGDEQSFFP